jgi:microcystin-dependent protein
VTGTAPTAGEIDTIDAAVSASFYEVMRRGMIGAIVPVPFAAAPPWGLLCNGATVLRSDYPDLWDVYPSGGKTETSLVLPNLSGMVILGAGVSWATGTNFPVYSTGGEEAHVLTEAEIPTHSHSYIQPIPNVDLEAPGVPDIIAAGINPLPQQTGSVGNGQEHNNLQPYAALYYVIVAS